MFFPIWPNFLQKFTQIGVNLNITWKSIGFKKNDIIIILKYSNQGNKSEVSPKNRTLFNPHNEKDLRKKSLWECRKWRFDGFDEIKWTVQSFLCKDNQDLSWNSTRRITWNIWPFGLLKKWLRWIAIVFFVYCFFSFIGFCFLLIFKNVVSLWEDKKHIRWLQEK